MPRRKAWTPPEWEWTALGPIPIELAERLEEDGRQMAGLAHMYGRKIQLDSTLPELSLRIVHLHELLHIYLHDAGVQISSEMEEVIVHALATALVAREDFHGRSKRASRRA